MKTTIRSVYVDSYTTGAVALAQSHVRVGAGESPLLLSEGRADEVIRQADLLAAALNVELYVDGRCERTTT